jgi:hypothetical protein
MPGVAPCAVLASTESQDPPLIVVAVAVYCTEGELLTVMLCRTTAATLDAISGTVKELGLTNTFVTTRTVKLTGTTTGLFDACELMVMDPVYGPGAREAKFTNPTVMLPGVLPEAGGMIASQLPPP